MPGRVCGGNEGVDISTILLEYNDRYYYLRATSLTMALLLRPYSRVTTLPIGASVSGEGLIWRENCSRFARRKKINACSWNLRATAQRSVHVAFFPTQSLSNQTARSAERRAIDRKTVSTYCVSVSRYSSPSNTNNRGKACSSYKSYTKLFFISVARICEHDCRFLFRVIRARGTKTRLFSFGGIGYRVPRNSTYFDIYPFTRSVLWAFNQPTIAVGPGQRSVFKKYSIG
ncbi:hypothetical protein PUN28_015503 [Cardiocondyla obscurior]|uniref:Uncharacterized protein n=1 Tax=Cardiocondyla obscurior TaxID=286306 RepID=A0AAW2ETG0_9HYME